MWTGRTLEISSLFGVGVPVDCRGRDYDRAPKVISLVKTEHHYRGLTSIPALLNRSYLCRFREKSYNTEDSARHNCFGQNCSACHRGNKGCPNYAKWVTPDFVREQCHVKFYGPECFEALRQKKERVEKCL